MIIYNILFLIPIIGIVLNINQNNFKFKYIELIYLFSIFILIGFRYEIGGDWVWYERNFYDFGENFNFRHFNSSYNYGYTITNYILYKLKFNFISVNIFCAILLVFSIKLYLNSIKSNKLLSYIIFFPLGFIVMGMGFVRQGCALSFFLISLSFMKRNDPFNSYLMLFFGILFHKSLILFAPVYFLLFKNFRLFFTICSLFFIFYFYQGFIDLYNIYLGKYKGLYYDFSYGAQIRMSLNSLSSLLFLIYGKYLVENKIEYKFYFNISIIVLICQILSFISPTFFDRLNYFFIFIQIVVFSNLSEIFFKNYKIYINILVCMFYFLVLNIFLIYGIHSKFWIPYKFFFFIK